jgi:hypothetical protein
MARTLTTSWSKIVGAGGIGNTLQEDGAGRVGEGITKGQERLVD